MREDPQYSRKKWNALFYPMPPDFRKSTAFLEGSQASPFCPGKCNMHKKMSMEHWWDDTDRGGTEVFGEKKTCPSATVHHRSYMD
jgi:hypothetical protein